MKTTLSLLALITMLFTFSSCEKDNPSPTYPIVGLWIGSYGITSGAPPADSLYYSLNLRSDSSVITHSMGADGNTYYGTGTWSLTGTTLSATITTSNFSQAGAVQKLNADYNSKDGKLTSGVINSVGGNFSATFNLDRVN
jgi:hypothetical protein